MSGGRRWRRRRADGGSSSSSAENSISALPYDAPQQQQPPPQQQQQQPPHSSNNNSCRRHRNLAPQTRFQPWDDRDRPVLGRGTAQSDDLEAMGGVGGAATESGRSGSARFEAAASSPAAGASGASPASASSATSNPASTAAATSSRSSAASAPASSAAPGLLAVKTFPGFARGNLGLCFSCKFSGTARPLTFSVCHGRPHDNRCVFRPYPCPCPGLTACPWQGSLRGVLPHLAHAHPSVPHLRGTDVLFQATNLERPPPTFWLMVQVCLGHQFLLVLEKRTVSQEVRFATCLLLVGPGHLAPSFTYRVELGSSHHRRLSYEATPRPLRDGVARVIADKDGLFFGQEVARLFAENDSLAIGFSIARY
ncbi:uncharacterized protein LOC116954542 [Petromyzon marinus]|uniref:uncharacterized protein LOC116954542 n=1 Tax=Petromyzon marinus TaxID=7757 RepID=UPI003F6E5C43